MALCGLIFWTFLCVGALILAEKVRVFPLCPEESASQDWLLNEMKPSKARQHVAVLPEPVPEARLDLAEKGVWPLRALKSIGFEAVHCVLRVEACPDCVVGFELDSVRPYFTQFQVERISNCDNPKASMSDSCFSMEFLEEHADLFGHSIDRNSVYRRVSVWNWPESRVFNSSGHSVTVKLAMRNVESQGQLFSYLMQLFPIKVTVYKNTEVHESSHSSEGFVQSPRYPHAYPRHMVKNYIIESKKSDGRVKLSFDDFLLDYQSHLKIFDSDETELFNSMDTHRRPPTTTSKGPRLTLLFVSGSFSQLVGFRAKFEFVSDLSWTKLPSEENCDEYFESYGGQINLENRDHLWGKNVDCVWTVGRLPSSFGQIYDQVYLKVDRFQSKSPDLKLEVRKGFHSTGDRLLELNGRRNLNLNSVNTLVNNDSEHAGFYLRLRGRLFVDTELEVVFSLFYRWATASCPGRNEFHCENSKCIRDSLHCDGRDHCGDGSDEVCHVTLPPHPDQDSDVTMLLAMALSLVGVVLVLLSLIALILGLHRRKLIFCSESAPPNTETTSRAESTEMTPSIHTIGDRRFYLLSEPHLNVIEAPPTYDDALKHQAMEGERRGSCYSNNAFLLRSIEDNEEVDEVTVIPENTVAQTVTITSELELHGENQRKQGNVTIGIEDSESEARPPSPEAWV